MVVRDQDGKAGDGDCDWEQCKEEPMFERVGKIGDDECKDERGCPWRDGV